MTFSNSFLLSSEFAIFTATENKNFSYCLDSLYSFDFAISLTVSPQTLIQLYNQNQISSQQTLDEYLLKSIPEKLVEIPSFIVVFSVIMTSLKSLYIKIF